MFEQNFMLLLGRITGLMGLAAIGWLLVRRSILDHTVMKGLAWIVVDITLPALIFIGMISLSEHHLPVFALLAGGFLVSLAGLLVASWTLKLKKLKNKGTFLFTVAVANSSFLPLPLAYALWGDVGASACLIYILGNNFFVFSLGISLFRLDYGATKNIDFTMLYRHPQALAALLGLLWMAGGLSLPTWAFQTIEGLGQSTIPMAMLATGGLLAVSTRKVIGNRLFLWLGLGLKLVALPALTVLILKMTDIKGVLAGILLLQAAMPSLASAAAYASRFRGDPVLAGRSSFWSSLVALVTIPLWMALGAALGLY